MNRDNITYHCKDGDEVTISEDRPGVWIDGAGRYYIEWEGKLRPAVDVAAEHKVSAGTVTRRLREDWPVHLAVAYRSRRSGPEMERAVRAWRADRAGLENGSLRHCPACGWLMSGWLDEAVWPCPRCHRRWEELESGRLVEFAE
jgi:hypothetical protein